MVFYFLGIQRIGIARSAPLKGSAPVFAVVFAFGILGERLALLQYFGIAMVVGGILVISTEGWSRIQAPPLSHSSKKDGLTSGSPNKLYYLFPVLAGLMGGIASTLFKISMSEMPSALLGVWIGSTEGLLLFPLIALLFPHRQRYQFSLAALRWAILAGVFASAAMYGLVLSIGMGQVSVVFTLAQTSPVFVIALSALFLRRVERVTLRVILGAVLTVGGGVLVGSY
jgi:drug/metabolite transporter (DMT)-like permease